MAISQLHNKHKKTLMIVLTDGEDNSSRHTYQECLDLVQECPGVTLSIVHVGTVANQEYTNIVQQGRGTYALIEEREITVTIRTTFRAYYR